MNKISYGIDAPNIIRNLFLVCMATVCGYFLAPWFLTDNVLFFAKATMVSYFVCCLFPICYMLFSSLHGKIKQCQKIVDSLNLKGNEIILDVGSGRGLYAITAASKLSTGKVAAVDMWRSVDLTGNSADALMKNANLASVSDRIDVHTADACSLPFADQTFDIILSSFMLHNISDINDRAKALGEIIRVLKPGGRIVLQDFMNTYDYANYLDQQGIQSVDLSSLQPLTFPFARIVTGTKAI